MISIRSSAGFARALNGPLAPDLRRLLLRRRDQLLDGADLDLGRLVHFIVVQPGDTIATIEADAEVTIATNFADGGRFGEPDFVPSFEWVQHHEGGWIEAVLILSDDGFAVALFVPDHIDTDPELLRLLAA